MACLSRLAVASVNTHRTRWPTPTPTQTRSYIHLCTQMYNPPPPSPSGRSCLSPSAGFNPPRSRQPLGYTDTELHHYYLAGLVYLPSTAESEFCKSRTALAPLTIILKRKFERILINSVRPAANYASAFEVKYESFLFFV